MNRTRLAALLAPAALTVPAAVSLAATSHAKFWQNKGASVVCGLENGSKKFVICSAKGIPRAKSGTGDPFVRIAKTGKAQLVLESQDPFVGTAPATLAAGSNWSSRGVSCQIASNATVLCFNGENHGFRIGDKHYHSF